MTKSSLRWPVVQELEKNGRWQEAIAESFALAKRMPHFSHLFALDVDRLLSPRLAGHRGVTYSAYGLSPAAVQGGLTPEILNLFSAPTSRISAANTIFNAFRLANEQGMPEALRYAFEHAQAREIDALNILYANYSVKNEKLWLYFLNKYLSQFDFPPLHLQEGSDPRFLRITTGPQRVISNGPIISVLMPAYNSAKTLEHACTSILQQTWQPLELILVDDASTDQTWAICQKLAKEDCRVKIHRNAVNVGPYVSKNIALQFATGDYLTCHDGDDWAFPDRLAQQIAILRQDPKRLKATTGTMLRLTADGEFVRAAQLGNISDDGILRRCFVSLFVEAKFFRQKLGAWDSVRIGADSELMARLEVLSPDQLIHDRRPLMLCLDHPASLTRDIKTGIHEKTGLTKVRVAYQEAWNLWHNTETNQKRFKLSFPPPNRRFKAPKEIVVEIGLMQHLCENLAVVPLKPEVSTLKDKAPAPVPVKIATAGLKASRNVIFTAQQMMREGRTQEALDYAVANANEQERLAINLLQCNLVLADEQAWLRYLNDYIAQFGIAPVELMPTGPSRFHRLTAQVRRRVENGPLVSIIMPAFNAGRTLEHSAYSILNQTWRPIELIIMDDASTDDTFTVAKRIAATDSRVKVYRNAGNVGPYVSKTIALRTARGEYVTGHDADDWAHPERIESHLAKMFETRKNGLKASLGSMLRMSVDGEFSRLTQVTPNTKDGALAAAFISCMFETRFLKEILGGWDEVRFAGDSELIRRTEMYLKSEIVRFPLMGMICLDAAEGLTNDPEHGYSPVTGLSQSRRLYKKSFMEWHDTLGNSIPYLPFPQRKHGFPKPQGAAVDAEALAATIAGHTPFDQADAQKKPLRGHDHCDICIVTDLRFPGGNASSTLDEIRSFREMGLRLLIVHCPADVSLSLPVSHRFENYQDICEFFYNITAIETDVLIIRHPAVLISNALKVLTPLIKSRNVVSVINNSMYRHNGEIIYSCHDIFKNTQKIESLKHAIFPLGPAIRAELEKCELPYSHLLASFDWCPTFDAKEFSFTPKQEFKAPFSIGRHGRDSREKWLEGATELLMAYPENGDFSIKILGGAANALDIIGRQPKNWEIMPFGSLPPAEFLAKLDVFVYYPNSHLNEAFGRTIMEAIFSGVPCVLPHRFKSTFADLAFFAEPEDVAAVIQRLSRNPEMRMEFLKYAHKFAIENYDSSVLIKRLTSVKSTSSHVSISTKLPGISNPLPEKLAAYIQWVETGQ